MKGSLHDTRYELVVSKVRPTKKLFILNPTDLDQFRTLIEDVTFDLSGITSLFLLANEHLYSANTVAFVYNQDPDVILNYSNESSAELARVFLIPVMDPGSLRKLIAPLIIFDSRRGQMAYTGQKAADNRVLVNTQSGDGAEEWFKVVNYGLISKEKLNELSEIDFADYRFDEVIANPEEVIYARKTNNDLLHLSEGFNFSTGRGSSVWEAHMNPTSLISDRVTVVMGDASSLESMVYFWNSRAAYPFADITWIPVEALSTYGELVERATSVASFVSSNSTYSHQLEGKLLDRSRYYYHTYSDNWKTMEAFHHVTVSGGSFAFTHPNDKLFSNAGNNCGLTIEVRGLAECIFPKSHTVGELFNPIQDKRHHEEYFARLGPGGLCLYCSDFKPMANTGLIQEVIVPSESEMIFRLMAERGLNITTTDKTTVAEKFIHLAGGLTDLDFLADRRIFDLLVGMAPRRLERLKTDLVKAIGKENLDADKLGAALDKLDLGESLTPPTTRSVTEMCPSGMSKECFNGHLQNLYDRNILLRGKYFPCPSCRTWLWFSVEELAPIMTCYCCGASVPLPVVPDGDHFRLNQLVVQAVDQGQLPVALTARFIRLQRARAMHVAYASDVEIPRTMQKTDIDLIVTYGRKLGIIEVKADRGFAESQVDTLLGSAESCRVDFVMFATLKANDSEEVITLCEQLRKRALKIPALILTSGALFTEKPSSISKYFETFPGREEFPSGPIIVGADR